MKNNNEKYLDAYESAKDEINHIIESKDLNEKEKIDQINETMDHLENILAEIKHS